MKDYYLIGFEGSYMIEAENECEAWKLYEKMKSKLPIDLELNEEKLIDI